MADAATTLKTPTKLRTTTVVSTRVTRTELDQLRQAAVLAGVSPARLIKQAVDVELYHRQLVDAGCTQDGIA